MPTRTPLAGLGQVKTKTRAVVIEVLTAMEAAGLPPLRQLWGYNPASRPEHSSGLAVDFMCSRAQGDWIANYLWANRRRLGVRWIIWRQRIRSTTLGKPLAWVLMRSRGSVTRDHYDHVHLFLNSRPYAPVSTPVATTVKPGWYTVNATGGLYGLTGPGAPAARKYLRPNGYPLWIVRWDTGPDGRRWGVTRYGTYYSADYLKAGKL